MLVPGTAHQCGGLILILIDFGYPHNQAICIKCSHKIAHAFEGGLNIAAQRGAGRCRWRTALWAAGGSKGETCRTCGQAEHGAA